MFRRIPTLCTVVAAALLPGCGGGHDDAGPCVFSTDCRSGSGSTVGGAGAIAFERSGTGANVVELPGTVGLVRIQGRTANDAENFIVYAHGTLLDHEIVGASRSPQVFDGTCSVDSGATLEVRSADGVDWTVTGSRSTAPPTTGLFSRQGEGDTVFALPTRETRYEIRASYSGGSQHFIVRVGDRLRINSIIGTSRNPPGFDGIYPFAGGRVEIVRSSGVRWSFVELAP